ncbi:MAG: helicase/secretion neighborhood TadE-like protein [Acidimicrobiaceae bacterium]|jgi:hypothetical protein|nr:helicase/secretion neighborhood TadE-like protein [Acidimicrobiaceae bacterium]MBT5580823.1 helicase/secretion neighborhood TadE-like protein [Acidimicrobiaceae bacterium]MBT5850984.1 helicase/secretion neighborhood TadE-like protein [Acidimicrobiaceae bacterium]
MDDTRTDTGVLDGGQILPLVAVVLMVSLGAVLMLARLAPLVDDAARARTAADAAALAGAAEGRDAAVEFAHANGGVLVDYRRVGSVVRVEVRVGHASADASARFWVDWVALYGAG